MASLCITLSALGVTSCSLFLSTGGLGDERKQHMHAESFGMIADGVDEIRRAVRLCCREGVDNVKFNISGANSSRTHARKSSR